jgi:hypothetical protein
MPNKPGNDFTFSDALSSEVFGSTGDTNWVEIGVLPSIAMSIPIRDWDEYIEDWFTKSYP